MTIIQADILEWAEDYDGEPFHAALLDPPYHLTELHKRWSGTTNIGATKDVFARAARGFMGKQWDGGDVAFRPETWVALARHLHPGAFGMAFASTKGYHRMACAIEDAGLIIHPMLVYAFGSGFPKATRIDTQVDRRAGAARRVVGQKKHQPKFDAAGHGYREKDNGFNSKDRESFDVTAPATEMAQAWEGHRYGGQVLKPALEPICVFQKPYQGRPVDCITRTGAGAINVDGGRVGTSKDVPASPSNNHHIYGEYNGNIEMGVGGKDPNLGRWPANLLLQHTPACRAVGTRRVKGNTGGRRVSADGWGWAAGGERPQHAAADGYETVTAWECAESCPVAALDRQSGVSISNTRPPTPDRPNDGRGTWQMAQRREATERGHSDSGGASRFFHQSHWAYEIEERIAAADPVRYCAKASKAEREGGLDPIQIKLLGMMDVFDETTVDDGRQTSIDNPYLRGETKRRNTNPCIKPISLTRYLATLLLPPDLYAPRRILVPFAGAGSEAIGAMLAGWEEVIGVELEAQHVAIATARMAFWRALRYRLLEPNADLGVSLGDDEDGQLSLWEAA